MEFQPTHRGLPESEAAVEAERLIKAWVLERGEPDGVLLPELVAFGLALGDGGVDVLVVQRTMALRTRPSAPSWSSMPSRYAWRMVQRLPWHTSRASLWRDSCTVSCRFICRR
ncbi:hypothetical protein GCM10010145_62350 [Streptomyces ruber]|uniref:Uncharacterized protein n=2 Tax=Streptomyces TaxID=1883 RepID=A0A918BQJ5_9ACTN|nr:hypothetical protein [Streptomyces ruber]GGQ84233.1 hypothetical protein GCM10010145_62350 [Streptomyces ruber]